jgi:membrane protein implicated in regulation of membrane protease activity
MTLFWPGAALVMAGVLVLRAWAQERAGVTPLSVLAYRRVSSYRQRRRPEDRAR